MAISKIKINNVEHELQTTIQNVSGLEAQLNNKISSNQGTANSGKVLGIGADGLVIPTESGGMASLRHDSANKTVVLENVSVGDTVAAGLTGLGITATAEELNYMDGVTSNVQTQFTNAYNRANKFFPDFAMHSIVTDCLNISIMDDWATSSTNRDGVVATEDVSTLVNSPIDSGAFYAYRTVRQVECAGRNPKTIVTLTEAYPMAGRVWINAYNPDTSSWSGWSNHDDACTYRDNAKTITDIVTNGVVYVCDPTLTKVMPIEASSFNGYTLGAACAKSYQDSTSAGTLSSSRTGLCTERDIYYGLPTINGSHSYTSSTNIYAPTAVGSNGQLLVSNGSGAPSWKSMDSLIGQTHSWTLNASNFIQYDWGGGEVEAPTHFKSGQLYFYKIKGSKLAVMYGTISVYNPGASVRKTLKTSGTIFASGFEPAYFASANVYKTHPNDTFMGSSANDGGFEIMIRPAGVDSYPSLHITFANNIGDVDDARFTITYITT